MLKQTYFNLILSCLIRAAKLLFLAQNGVRTVTLHDLCHVPGYQRPGTCESEHIGCYEWLCWDRSDGWLVHALSMRKC